MFDLSQCPQFGSKWLTLTKLVSRSLTLKIPLSARVAVAVLIILGIVWVFWWIRRSNWRRQFRWRRRWTKIVIALTVICLVVTSPPSVNLAIKALEVPIPSDSGNKADAIVILGRGRPFYDRTSLAVDLWQSKRAPKIFVSGFGDAPPMAEQLKMDGVPDSAIDGEACSETTDENAQFTAERLKPQGAKRIILVTDRPHMLRSILTFESFGFEVIPRATGPTSQMGYREKAVLLIREFGGLLSYSLKGRFFNRDAPTATTKSLTQSS